MVLDKEREYFEANRAELVKKYKNLFVLIKDKELIGVHGSAREAYAAGLAKFGPVPFVVKQVLEDEPVAFAPVYMTTPRRASP